MDPSDHVALAESANGAVVIFRIKRLSLHLNRHIAEHLVELIIGTDVMFTVLDELQGEEPGHILLHLEVDLIPLIDAELRKAVISLLFNNARHNLLII